MSEADDQAATDYYDLDTQAIFTEAIAAKSTAIRAKATEAAKNGRITADDERDVLDQVAYVEENAKEGGAGWFVACYRILFMTDKALDAYISRYVARCISHANQMSPAAHS